MSQLPSISGIAALQSASAQAALLNLHGSLEFSELWPSLQNLFETVVPHDTLVMSVNYLDWRREISNKRLSSAKSARPHGGGPDRVIVEEGRSFFMPFLDANTGIRSYQHSQLHPNHRTIVNTLFYRRYMKHYGWRYSAHMLMWNGASVETSFAFRRRAEQGDFTPAEMDVLNAIHPHVEVAIQRMKTFEQERQRRRLLEGFYRAKPEAVLFLDWNLEPVYVSQDAFDFCAIWNLGAEKARSYAAQAVFQIPAGVAEACDEMRREWQAQTGGPIAPESGGLMRHLHGADPRHEALITLRPERGGTLTKPVFVVRLRVAEDSEDPLATPESSQDRVMHQLTPAQRELARLVSAGLTNKEIAGQLNKTEGSIKVQLSAIFRKLRVNNRAKLIVALR